MVGCRNARLSGAGGGRAARRLLKMFLALISLLSPSHKAQCTLSAPSEYTRERRKVGNAGLS